MNVQTVRGVNSSFVFIRFVINYEAGTEFAGKLGEHCVACMLLFISQI